MNVGNETHDEGVLFKSTIPIKKILNINQFFQNVSSSDYVASNVKASEYMQWTGKDVKESSRGQI